MDKFNKYGISIILIVLILLVGSFFVPKDEEKDVQPIKHRAHESSKYGHYLYMDKSGCFHASRKCSALQKMTGKNNGVKLVKINDEARKMLPYRSWVCPVCFPDEMETTLDSCTAAYEYDRDPEDY